MSVTLRTTDSRFPLVLLIFASCAAALDAQHTIPETTAQAAVRATAIVTARVLDVRVRDEGWIYTYVDFETLDAVKGSVPARFTYRIFGGSAGSREVSGGEGQPSYRKGEEVVLFMVTPPNPFPIVIESHVYKIVTRNGVRLVTPTPTGLDLLIGTAAERRATGDASRLDAFLGALRRQP